MYNLRIAWYVVPHLDTFILILLIFRLGISDAYYCAECTRLEKDRDGCPKIVNLGASRTDLFYERRRLGMQLEISLDNYSDSRIYSGFKKG